MKKILVCSFIFFSYWSFCQIINYKKLAVPNIDINGNITNAQGIKMGSIDDSGIIKNAKDEKIATIDAFGTLIETATEKRIAKSDVNGNVYPIKIVKGGFKGWKLTMPEPGVEICLIRDDKKKLVAATHKHFKQNGGVAIFYLKKISSKK